MSQSAIMISLPHFLRLSLRNLANRNLWMTLINVSCLSIAFLMVLGAFLFTVDELQYDRFHPNSHRLYRLVVDDY